MLTMIFLILMLGVFGKLLMFALKAAWGLTKIFFTIIFLPVILLALFFMGAVYLALPILIIVGIIAVLGEIF